MRLLIAILLTLLALGAWADGCIVEGYRPYFENIQETDQAAVIRLQPNRVTLDMYIAIDGIPKGQTVTYILPFWQKPEGFTMTPMASVDFSQQCIDPLREQFEQEQEIRDRALFDLDKNYLTASVYLYPLLAPAAAYQFWLSMSSRRGKGSDSASASAPPLTSYDTVNTPAGSADLYRVSTDQDLQTLVARAGLPEKYTSVLRKYHTRYYAMMHLHGMADKGNVPSPGGLHFHFTHQAAGERYTYIYPLGTGGAWAKPITLTEVYATCPDGYRLTAKAPFLGKKQDYYQLDAWVNGRDIDGDPLKDTPKATTTASLTDMAAYATAWHRAYYMSNPTEDISLTFAKRRVNPASEMITTWLTSSSTSTPFIVMGYLLAMFLAVQLIVRRAWMKAGRPGMMRQYVGRFLVFTLKFWLLSLCLGLILCASIVICKCGLLSDQLWINIAVVIIVDIVMYVSIYIAYRNLEKMWQRADGELRPGTMLLASFVSIVCYFLLLPVWPQVTHLLAYIALRT